MRLKFRRGPNLRSKGNKKYNVNPAAISSKLKAQSDLIIQQNPTESAYI